MKGVKSVLSHTVISSSTFSDDAAFLGEGPANRFETELANWLRTCSYASPEAAAARRRSWMEVEHDP